MIGPNAIPAHNHSRAMPHVPAKPAQAGVVNMMAGASKRVTLGANLVEQTFLVAKTSYQALQFASQKGTRTVCAVAAVGSGAANLYAGNFVSGFTLAGCGAKDLYNIICSSNQDAGTRLKELLSNAGAGVAMVKTLEEANRQTFDVITSNLMEVQKGVEGLNTLITSVGKIAQNAGKEVVGHKLQSETLCKAANDLYAQAHSKLSSSSYHLEMAGKLLDENIADNERMIAQARMGGENCVVEFFLAAHQVRERSIEIKTLLDRSAIEMDEGMKLLHTAKEKQQDAAIAATRALDAAAHNLALIAAKSQANKEAAALVGTALLQMGAVKERSGVISEISGQNAAELEAAKAEANALCDNTSMVLGGTPGFMIGNALAGPIGGAAGLLIGANMVQKRQGIFAIARKIYQFIFGKSGPDFMPAVSAGSFVSYQYSAHSCGIRGWFKGRQSWTKGEVHIKIGSQVHSYAFDLKKEHKISQENVVKLYQHLLNALKSNEITCQECMEIITTVENTEIHRGDEHAPAQGFIAPNHTYLQDLRNLCTRISQGISGF